MEAVACPTGVSPAEPVRSRAVAAAEPAGSGAAPGGASPGGLGAAGGAFQRPLCTSSRARVAGRGGHTFNVAAGRSTRNPAECRLPSGRRRTTAWAASIVLREGVGMRRMRIGGLTPSFAATTFTTPTELASRGADRCGLAASRWHRRSTGGAGRRRPQALGIRSGGLKRRLRALSEALLLLGAPDLDRAPLEGGQPQLPGRDASLAQEAVGPFGVTASAAGEEHPGPFQAGAG